MSILKSIENFTPVTIEPKNVYGIRSEVTGNIHFTLEEEVIYPVEGVVAFHDYVNNNQRFLRLPPTTKPIVITINSTRQFLAIVEVFINENQERQTDIVIYDLIAFKKHRTFELPANAKSKNITRMTFTCNSKALVVLTDYPDEMIYMIIFDRLGTVIEGRAGNSNHKGMANFIALNPVNADIVAVCGNEILKLMVKSERNFTVYGDIKANFNATAITWVSMETFIIGTANGLLMVFVNGVRKGAYKATEILSLDITVEADVEITLPARNEDDKGDPNPEASVGNKAIVCLRSFPKGLAFAVFNQVFVFEKASKTKYERKTILDIPMTNYPKELYQIKNMAINARQDTVIVTPRHSQIYVGILIVPESLETKMLHFHTLGELVHIDEILDICICAWRPIIVTTSKDRTVRLWNYRTGKVELVKCFPIDVTVIELYASGQYAAIAFKDNVKIMEIFMDDLGVVKIYNFPRAKEIKFSCYGHLMATAYDDNIAITSVFTLENLRTLKGHKGTVLTLAWSRNDKSVISGGADGAVYQWDIETGNRLQEIVRPGLKYNSVCVPNDSTCIYAATNSGCIFEIRNSQVVREIRVPFNSPLTDICLTRSDLVMFVSTIDGHLYNVHLPLSAAGGGTLTRFPFFNSAITKLRFSYDGTLLISSSASGSLIIWQLKNIEGRVVPIDQDLLKSQEVLIPRLELEHKINTIKQLEFRLKKQAAEFYKKQSQNEENEAQQIADTHKGYCEALTELDAKNKEVGVRHVDELKQITLQIDELNAEHDLTMEKLSIQYSERMAMEHQKFYALRESIAGMRESYEKKLRESDGCLTDTVDAMENDYNKQLEERQELIRELMQEMDDKKVEFSEYCRSVEVENDRKMIDCQINYENKVKFEIGETNKWVVRANDYQAGFDTAKKECDIRSEQVKNLREQHFKSKDIIAGLRNEIKDLEAAVADREHAINVKEKRIDEMYLKNEELVKYKLVLNHKLNELKAQIEPREQTIIEKRKRIAEMEQELAGLQKNNLQLQLQLKELKDKCISVNVEVKHERARARAARLCVTHICTDIFALSKKMGSADMMKAGIRELFLKYSNDEVIKTFTSLGAQEQANLQRQRVHIENIKMSLQEKMESKITSVGSSRKLINDHKILLEEVSKSKSQNERMRAELKNIKLLLEMCRKVNSRRSTVTSMMNEEAEGLLKTEDIQNHFESKIESLKMSIESKTKEKDKYKRHIGMKKIILKKN